MKRDVKGTPAPCYLGIEAGGTRTVALLDSGDGTAPSRLEMGPANLRLLD
jgi:N-acetylglucosamine kinase-like BadF-type ATPase